MSGNVSKLVYSLREYAEVLEQLENARRVKSRELGLRVVRVKVFGSTDVWTGACGRGIPREITPTQINDGEFPIESEAILGTVVQCLEEKERLRWEQLSALLKEFK